MAKFKVGDKVVLSKLMHEECLGSEWSRRAEQMMRDEGFLIVSEVFEPRAYIMEGLPAILFTEEWLEPYIDSRPSTPNPGRPAYMPRGKWFPCDAPAYLEEFSVRDRFAAAALMCFRADLFTAPEYVAEKAYKIADAMMEARKI